MKFDIERVRLAFRDNVRRLQHQVWGELAPIMSARLKPFAEIPNDSLDLAFDLDAEISDEDAEKRADALIQRVGGVANRLAAVPAFQLTSLLEKLPATEVTIPAGSDPLDPAEIRSAVKRALREIDDADGFTILFAGGAQDAFYAALDDDGPTSMLDRHVRLRASMELLDKSILDELFGDGETSSKPEDAAAKMQEAARHSSWYLIPHRSKKPFEFAYKCEPKLSGPKLKLDFACELRCLNAKDVVRVSPSRIILAQASDVPQVVAA